MSGAGAPTPTVCSVAPGGDSSSSESWITSGSFSLFVEEVVTVGPARLKHCWSVSFSSNDSHSFAEFNGVA